MASNPQYYDATLNQWVLIAAGVTTGNITRLNPELRYYLTYKQAGQDAPEASVRAVTLESFVNTNYEPIGATAPIDIYVWAETNYPDTARLENCLQVGV